MENNQQRTTAILFPIATHQIKDLVWTIGFIFSAVIIPAFLAHTAQNQWVTGTIVNALLFLAVWRVGVVNAMLVAALPSSIALVRGLLPAPMVIVIPWIIISNFILIMAFYFAKKYPVVGIVFAATAKFLFLFATTAYFIKISNPFLFIFQWPQLFTALAGGLIASGIIKIAKGTE